jgi:hypothetical protein
MADILREVLEREFPSHRRKVVNLVDLPPGS